MKRFLYYFSLVLGMSMALCSCNKENTNAALLEGKWWTPEKIEMLENGKVVEAISEDEYVSFGRRMKFQSGKVTFEDLNQTFSDDYSYVLKGDVIEIKILETGSLSFSTKLSIIKLMASELVLSIDENDEGLSLLSELSAVSGDPKIEFRIYYNAE